MLVCWLIALLKRAGYQTLMHTDIVRAYKKRISKFVKKNAEIKVQT